MSKIELQHLTSAARQDFEAIVGKDFICDDPATRCTHSWNTAIGGIVPPELFAKNWPIAVVLPSTTEEVAKIVKCCITHGLKYKAASTAYGGMGNVASSDSVAIDLRRMNHMEIIPEDRMAVIGPYVTAGQLQAEALKHGMTCHIVGAGPAHSPLASATSLMGIGISSTSTGVNMRNLLSWEWVSPEGEIFRGGSAAEQVPGRAADWFAGEGPGPGSRGLIRGFFGGAGSLGVFTKIGYKLYPTAMSDTVKQNGQVPQIGTEIPEHAALYQVAWDNWDDHRDATFKLLQDDLIFAMLRLPAHHMGWTVTATNAEWVDKFENGSLPPVAKFENDKNWTLLLLSRSAEEQAWREKALRSILDTTGGRFVELSSEEESVLFHGLFTSQYVPRALRGSGGIVTSYGILDSFHFMPRAMDAGQKSIDKANQEGGDLLRGGSEGHWSWPCEGRYLWSENILDFDPRNPKSLEASARGFLGHYREVWDKDNPAGIPALAVGPLAGMQGDKAGSAHRYVNKVKEHFDPHEHAKSNEGVPLPFPKPVEKLLPLARPVFKNKAVQKFMSKGIAKKGLY